MAVVFLVEDVDHSRQEQDIVEVIGVEEEASLHIRRLKYWLHEGVTW